MKAISFSRVVAVTVSALPFAFGAGCGDDASSVTTSSGSASGGNGSASGGSGMGGSGMGGSGTPNGGGGTGGSGGEEPIPSAAVMIVGSGDWNPSGTGSIATFRLDYATNQVTPLQTMTVGPLPSFMAVDDARRLVHVGDEVVGGITTYELMGDGSLVERASASGVGNPVHLAFDPSGAFLFVSHYGPGRTEVFGLDQNGWVNQSLDDVATGAQTHSTLVPSTGHLFAASKGDDQVAQLTFDGTTLTAGTPVATANGSGPRHLAMHPNGQVVYLVNELDRTLDTFDYDAAAGTLTAKQAPISLDDNGGSPEGTGADIHVHPSGDFLYVSVRHGGFDGDLVRCDLDANGIPTVAAHTDTLGETPRNFTIDPTGSYAVVANQDSANVILFDVGADGALTMLETLTVASKPFFVTLIPE